MIPVTGITVLKIIISREIKVIKLVFANCLRRLFDRNFVK